MPNGGRRNRTGAGVRIATVPVTAPVDSIDQVNHVASLPCAQCKSECCGSIPASTSELRGIVRHLAALPAEEVQRLARMRRAPLTCPLVDTERWRCSVWGVRPTVCRMYGYVPGMQCPYQPRGRVVSEEAERRALLATRLTSMAGVLGGDIGWDQLAPLVEAERNRMEVAEYGGR